MTTPGIRVLAAAVTAMLTAACAAPAPVAPAPAAAYDSALGLATFEQAWRIVYETHFDTTFNGVDWRALREELQPQAAQARSTADLRDVIDDMLDRLQQSHFALIPAEFADTLVPDEDTTLTVGDVGLDVRLLGDDLVVTQVEAGSPAEAAGIQPGWIVRTIDGDSLASVLRGIRARTIRYPEGFLLRSVAERRLGGAAGAAVTVRFEDGAGQPQPRTLVRRVAPSEPIKLGNLPTFFGRVSRSEHVTPEGRLVGRVWFNSWMPPLLRQVDEAVDAYRAHDGMVVDLRGNGGGAGGMVMGVAGHFLAERVSLGDFRSRRTTLQFRANPRLVSPRGERVEVFGGPVAILIDETSASASEVFAGGMQALGRVRVFGTTSLGGVLPALFDRLPNRDVLYHAIADFVTAGGIVLEGRGVIPDEPVRPTRDALLAGRDPVLEAALRWIDRQAAATDSL